MHFTKGALVRQSLALHWAIGVSGRTYSHGDVAQPYRFLLFSDSSFSDALFFQHF